MGNTMGCCGVSRRGFVVGAGAGVVTGTALALVTRRRRNSQSQQPASFTGKTAEVPKPALGMPGAFPGRVIEVRHESAVRPDHTINPEPVEKMMARGMCELTGADHPDEAWKRFFEKGDVVGIKVNPVGRRPLKGEGWRRGVGAVSNAEVVLEIVAGLKSAGVRTRDIVVFERYAREFRDTKFNGTETGYEELMRTRMLDGARWYASSAEYDELQTEIDGLKPGRRKERDPHVVGYDPDVFVTMGFAAPESDPKDDRRFRTHLSLIVTKMCNKIITIPVLKDHRSGGVTLTLKNLSHGMNNNVCRSHISSPYQRLGKGVSMPNQNNTFIPLAAGQQPTREKAVLHIMDGLIGVYEGGPGNWNPTWSTWHRNSLFFSTDPVAMDHVGWDIIDRKRAREGWAPVAQMSNLLNYTAAELLSPRLAMLAANGVTDSLTLAHAAQHVPHRVNPNEFDRRQPEHIILAGTMGMGIFDARNIEHRAVQI
jgi:hypothetical protein